MQDVKQANAGELQPSDIIFECPQCGKSLAIDVRGAGYIVKCPDCATQIQVPGVSQEEDGTAAPVPVVLDPQSRIAHLERLRHLDQERIAQISREIALIQAAIDRIGGLIEDAQVSGASSPEEDEN